MIIILAKRELPCMHDLLGVNYNDSTCDMPVYIYICIYTYIHTYIYIIIIMYNSLKINVKFLEHFFSLILFVFFLLD